MHGIERDRERFRQIIRGRIKQNLRKYMTQDGIDVLGRRGNQKITIPLPHIDLPRFRYGKKGGGIGEGEGPGKGNKGGEDPADNPLEVDVSLDEMAELLSEELQLPRIEPKGKSEITTESKKYRTIRTMGPESLRHFKKTFVQALKRTVASGDYDPNNPLIIPIKEDKRYKASTPVRTPRYQAVIIYMMDVSGSMGQEEKELARLTSFWIDLWLRSQYDCIQSRYIIHNFTAKEVDQHTFYRTAEGGGTRIASAYEMMRDIIKADYGPDWNIYSFQYSDGEDWSETASTGACNIISDLLPLMNQVSYCQVREGGHFKNVIENRFKGDPRVVSTKAFRREEILDAIKNFFNAGR